MRLGRTTWRPLDVRGEDNACADHSFWLVRWPQDEHKLHRSLLTEAHSFERPSLRCFSLEVLVCCLECCPLWSLRLCSTPVQHDQNAELGAKNGHMVGELFVLSLSRCKNWPTSGMWRVIVIVLDIQRGVVSPTKRVSEPLLIFPLLYWLPEAKDTPLFHNAVRRGYRGL